MGAGDQTHLLGQGGKVDAGLARERECGAPRLLVRVEPFRCLVRHDSRRRSLDPNLDLLHLRALVGGQSCERRKEVPLPEEVDRLGVLGELGWEGNGLMRLDG